MQETMTIESEGENPQLVLTMTVKSLLTLRTLHCPELNHHIPKLTPVLEQKGHLKDVFERNFSRITWNNSWVPECRKPTKTVA